MKQLVMPSVSLRAMEPEDLDMLYLIENDRELWDVGATNVPYSRYVLHDYLSSTSSDIYADKQVRLMAEDESHNVVGMADLTSFDPRHLRAEVGIIIQKPYRNRGYAHAMLDSMHSYALKVLHLHQLYAVIATANRPAMSLFLDMGYEQTALLKDWLYDGNGFCDACMVQRILKH